MVLVAEHCMLLFFLLDWSDLKNVHFDQGCVNCEISGTEAGDVKDRFYELGKS